MSRLTPPGRAAVAVLRLSGRLPSITPLRSVAGRHLAWPAPGVVRHARWFDGAGVVDDLVVRGLDDGVELHVHGGDGVLDELEATLLRAGFAPCPSSLTVTPTCLRHVHALASRLWGPLRVIEAAASHALARGTLFAHERSRLLACQARRPLARALARPPVVRLVGRPNAGKSTLFNALMKDERALVSPVAGTTRDPVVARRELGAVPVQFEDTAGVAGDARAQQGDADLLIVVLDADQTTDAALHGRGEAPPVIVVHGKADARAVTRDLSPRGSPLLVSGRTGRGVPELVDRMTVVLGLDGDVHDDVLAPVDEDLARLIERALALPDGSPTPT